MTVGQRLTSLRKQQGYNRTQFAEKIGIPQTTLRNYETDAREPGHKYLIQMAHEFNVSVDYLLGITDEKIKKEPDTQSVSSPDLQKIKETLVQFLTLAGYIKPGEDITDEQLRFLEGVVLLLDHYFDQQA